MASVTVQSSCTNAQKKTVRVSAAIIHALHNCVPCIFATQRGYGAWKDWWEFPGGKQESGEYPETAVVREIKEELDTAIEPDRLIATVEWDYPDFHLVMDCFWCSVQSGSLTLREHEAARWLCKGELHSVKWLPADKQLLPLIAGLLV